MIEISLKFIEFSTELRYSSDVHKIDKEPSEGYNLIKVIIIFFNLDIFNCQALDKCLTDSKGPHPSTPTTDT